MVRVLEYDISGIGSTVLRVLEYESIGEYRARWGDQKDTFYPPRTMLPQPGEGPSHTLNSFQKSMKIAMLFGRVLGIPGRVPGLILGAILVHFWIKIPT